LVQILVKEHHVAKNMLEGLQENYFLSQPPIEIPCNSA
jgi:hypothetical protein